MLYSCIQFAKRYFRPHQFDAKPPIYAPLNDAALRQLALHDAGHVLVYAALPDLPEDIVLRLRDCASSLCACHSERRQAPIYSKAMYLEWKMLVLMAGSVTERIVTGKQSHHTLRDQETWQELARSHLTINGPSMYFVAPQNAFEQQTNTELLERLRASQIALLETLVEQNQHIVSALTEALLDKECLRYNDLVPLISSIRLPESFPRPDLQSVAA